MPQTGHTLDGITLECQLAAVRLATSLFVTHRPLLATTIFIKRLLLSPFLSYPFPKRQILHSSKLKECADDNFKFDEYDRKFTKMDRKHCGKREIARYEQFLLFPQCFLKTYTADM